MKTNIKIATTLFAAILLQGCLSFNSLADAKNSRGTGMSKTYAANKAQVWQQTLGVIEKSDLSVVNEDFNKGLILAQQPVSPLSLTAGQNVAVYVSDAGDQTKVEVISKKAIGEIEFTSKNWEKYVIEQLDERMK